MTFTIDKARKFLDLSGIFCTSQEEFEGVTDPEEIEDLKWGLQVINLNDTWAWACSDCQKVEDEELPELAQLFWYYGYCGVLYWAAKKGGILASQFLDINRFIEFVENEERIKIEEPDWNKRAFYKSVYTLGELSPRERVEKLKNKENE